MSRKDTYDDIDLLLKDLKSDIEDVLMDEVLDEVKEIELSHIEDDVFSVYSPRVYKRRTFDGIDDPDNIVGEVHNMVLEVENIAEFTDWRGNAKRGTGLTEFVNDYDYPGIIDQNRPFIDNTVEEIERTDRVEDALAKGLIKRNYDVY